MSIMLPPEQLPVAGLLALGRPRLRAQPFNCRLSCEANGTTLVIAKVLSIMVIDFACFVSAVMALHWGAAMVSP